MFCFPVKKISDTFALARDLPNLFVFPLKAIRLIPLRWNEEISATISLNGCIFSKKSKKTKKASSSLKGQSLQSVQFRFRTAEKEGVLLDSGGGQEQDFLLALHDSQLHFKGVSMGNFLDDNRFHSVQLFFHQDSNFDLILDGMQRKINGSESMDFDDKVMVAQGFKGCMRDLLVNNQQLEFPSQVEEACTQKAKALLSFTTVRILSFFLLYIVKGSFFFHCSPLHS